MIATDLPFRQYVDLSGQPLDAGFLYFGQPNQNPETAPITVYWDIAGTQPVLQPVRTFNGFIVHNGAVANLFAAGEYSITVRDRNNLLICYAPTSLDFDSSTVLRTDLANNTDAAKGDALIGVKRTLTGAVATTLHNWIEAQQVNLQADFAAVAGTDISTKLQSAIDAVCTAGGGVIGIPAGTWTIGSTVILKTGVILRGAGLGVTVLKLATGANVDVIKTDGYGTFTSLSDAGVPHDYGLEQLTLDGNYFAAAWNNPTNTVNNFTGYGIKSYGYGFSIDVELINIPEVGALFEGEGAIPTTQDAYSGITVQGRVFGKEGLIIRGPGDGSLRNVWLGLCGIVKMPDAQTTVPVSTEYKSEPVTLNAADGSGTGAYGTAYLNADGSVQYVYVDEGGSGYTAGETVNIVPRLAGGIGATGAATVSLGKVTAVAVSTAGSGFVNRSPIDGIVVDDVNLEIGTIHVYACWAGTGFRARNGIRSGGIAGACRLEGNHLISESNRQQIHLESGTYGMIANTSMRNISMVHPNLTTVPAYPGENQGFDVLRLDCNGYRLAACQVFRNAAAGGKRITNVPAVIMNGDNNSIGFHYRNMNPVSGDPEFGSGVVLSGDAIHVYGNSNIIETSLDQVNGNGILERGTGNNITFSDRNGLNGYAYGRDGGATNGNKGRIVNGSVIATATTRVAFRSIQGTPTPEIISISYDLPAAATPFSGTIPDFTRSQQWNLSGNVGTTPSATKTYAQFNLDETVLTEQTVTVAHSFPFIPDYRQVDWSIDDRATSSDGVIAYIQLQNIDATNLTFKTKMTSVATNGANNRRVNVKIS